MSDELILYFSKSGNTDIVAKAIQKYTGADIFKIEPVNKYPSSYVLTVIKSRLEDLFKSNIKVKKTLDNIDDYKTIYIGFPNWAASFPRIMRLQLEKLDFKDKNIRLFVTHGNGGYGRSKSDIRKICSPATLESSFDLYDWNTENADRNVKEWLDELNKN